MTLHPELAAFYVRNTNGLLAGFKMRLWLWLSKDIRWTHTYNLVGSEGDHNTRIEVDGSIAGDAWENLRR